MALISRTTIDELNNRMDALNIVGEYVRMENKGGRWWGLCPFHNEKTPSFTVNPELKTYYCFGCNKGGSVLGFVMDMDKLSYLEAVEHLAKTTGIDIIYEGPSQTNQNQDEIKKKEALFELYRRMSGTFHHFLMKDNEALKVRNYVIDRGISEELIGHFRLGYAPLNRKWMYTFLTKKGYTQDFLNQSGLFSSRYTGLPLFSGRLMFPISDRQGRVVAFGGRYLEGHGEDSPDFKAPKYINSPEQEIYKKGETLYAIDLALSEIRKTKTVYLAEGYMDVIALHQAGIQNAVAPLGTAFTDEQARLLSRWAEKVIFVFDSDEAGQNAVVKGILCCKKNGMSSAVVVPEDIKNPQDPKDPADILKFYGPEALQKKIKCFINDFDYLVARAISIFNTQDSGGKSQAAAFIFPYLETLESEVTRDACIDSGAAAFGISKAALLADWRRYREQGQSQGQRNKDHSSIPIRMNDELFLLMTVAVNYMQGEAVYPEFRKILAIKEVDDPFAKELYIALEECFAHDERGIDFFLPRISSLELKKFYLERGVSKEFSLDPKQILADGKRKADRKRLERRREEIVLELKALKLNHTLNDTKGIEAEELLADKIHIDAELRKLKEAYQ